MKELLYLGNKLAFSHAKSGPFVFQPNIGGFCRWSGGAKGVGQEIDGRLLRGTGQRLPLQRGTAMRAMNHVQAEPFEDSLHQCFFWFLGGGCVFSDEQPPAVRQSCADITTGQQSVMPNADKAFR